MRRFGGLSLGVVLGVCLAGAPVQAEVPSWQPKASERLVKLPSNLLARSIERDFEKSALARALEESRNNVALKTQTLKDLKEAVERAEGEVRTELRHQYLVEKKEFIRLVGEQKEFERQQVNARMKVYAEVLEKLEQRGEGLTPQDEELRAYQDGAIQRFENSIAKVDLELFDSGVVERSRYAKEFAKNLAAIEKLVHAINTHPMNGDAALGGDPQSKQDYLRQLLVEAESELAILDQEESILGYMAKLVALDAMALAEGLDAEGTPAECGDEETENVLLSTVDLFVN